VNQLLSKIDGVDALNNILVIGMTNRPDMIDSAITRPGRLEIKIEIGLPDARGRSQILSIHTAGMRKKKVLQPDVDLDILTRKTKNFTGAEIAGLCRSAMSFALERETNPNDMMKRPDLSKIKVGRADFTRALKEVIPAFGSEDDDLRCLFANGVIDHGDMFQDLQSRLHTLVTQVKTSDRTSILPVLLEGDAGSGKTALVANLAIEESFPFTKFISPEKLVGLSEGQRVARIQQVFESAYKSPQSLIILDDLERILQFVAVGPRFSNTVLQALLVLIKRPPPPGRKLMVIGTTSNVAHMKLLGLPSVFLSTLHVPLLSRPSEIAAVLNNVGTLKSAVIDEISQSIKSPIAIKRLLNVLETVRQEVEGDDTKITSLVFERFESLNLV